MPLSLPQQVVDNVVDHLHASDPGSPLFHSIALVSRQFRERAQVYSFKALSFLFLENDGFCVTKLRDRRQILECNPKLARYVRRLLFPLVQETLWVFDHQDFIALMETLADALDGNDDMLQVDIRPYSPESVGGIPGNTMPDLLLSVGWLVDELTITFIKNVPCRWIADCINLVKLDISDSTIFKDQLEGTSSKSELPKIDELEVGQRCLNVYDISYMLDSAFDLSCLTRLHCDLTPPVIFPMGDDLFGEITLRDSAKMLLAGIETPSQTEHEHKPESYGSDKVRAILRACADSLEDITLSANDSIEIGDLYDLSTIPNLDSFSLARPILPGDDIWEDICALLKTIPSGKNKIDYISFLFTHWTVDGEDPMPGLEALRWDILDSTLVNLACGRTLELLIQVEYAGLGDGDAEDSEGGSEHDSEADAEGSEEDPEEEFDPEKWIAMRLPLAAKEPCIILEFELIAITFL
ncbi:hypothetical protein CVT26_005549 [Gymnopilus dilepis]|uniref:F-box domain-containing protein n=1 Tax=Gymnopilus dilepis TaxID=231916 RepID=A0A409WC27_9AGAR|nr:hypothetical protein CVT26_005549 [Gymnopilus dilepis]